MDESDQRAEAGIREINESFERVIDDFGQRLEAADKANKNSISAVRLTVDGLVARAAEQAVPLERLDARSAQVESALEAVRGSSRQASSAPGLPPFVTSQAGTHDRTFPSDLPPFLDDLPVNEGPVRGRGAEEDAAFSTPGVPPLADLPQDPAPAPAGPALSVIEQARRAAQAAARANEDKPSPRRAGPAAVAPSAQAEGGRSIVRRAIIGLAVTAVVVGLVLIFYTMFPGGEETAQTGADTWKVDETINPPADGDAVKAPEGAAQAPAAVAPPADGMPADPAATPDAAFAPVPGSPEGTAVDGTPLVEQPSEFISGTSALPERSKKETEVAILEAASARGEARSQFLLALRYAEGRGVPKDEGLSASLVSKAAEQGLAVAQYRLGMLHERGVGIEKSIPKAKLWYEKAAKLGNRKAMHNLAVLLADTTGGSQNYKEASRWFREGATYGLTDSQYNLAVLLEQGMGVEKNLKEAITWYAVAAEQGDTGAAERLEALKKTVPPADVGLALDAARKFKPRPLNPTVNELPALP
jgi:localization factor PodJL